MSARPRIAPDVAAALTAQIPARLVKKLDADPTVAERWAWAEATVQTDKGEVVTMTVNDGIITGVACSCLLSPKCLHVAAVVAALEPAEATVAEAHEPATRAEASAPEGARAIAANAFARCADVLATGAEATGALAQAELLRSIHACRGESLYRLAAAQTRLLRSIRDLRADRQEFALAVLAADLREALYVAYALSRGESSAELVGRARRDYESIGSLRLHGVFSEAVVARSGYAGCVTYLADDGGRLYTRADIAPGDVGRAAGAYDAPAGIGDAVLPHHELCRAGLFISNATASASGRLGAGKDVRAVRAGEPSSWDHASLAARWQRSLDDQLADVAANEGARDDDRPAGWDLVFVEGVMYGDALVVGDRVIHATSSHDHATLPARDNLITLARAPGLRVRAIGRVRLSAPRRLTLLAIGPASGETRIAFAESWQGRANIDYDRIAAIAEAPAPPPPRVRIAPVAADLLEPLRRRIERIALGGSTTLPAHALAQLERDAVALEARTLRAGADALRDLAKFASTFDRAMTGERRGIDRSRFARAWLRAVIYDVAARKRLQAAAW